MRLGVGPWVGSSSSSVCWEALEKGGCVSAQKAAAHTSTGLCGHKAASLPSRLFRSKQKQPGGKEPTALPGCPVSTADGAQAEQAGGMQKVLAQAYSAAADHLKHSLMLSPRWTCQGFKHPTKFPTRLQPFLLSVCFHIISGNSWCSSALL